MSDESTKTMSSAKETITQGNVLFSKELYKIVIKSTKGNVFISPLSIEVVLAMTHAGAQSRTAKQIATALHLSEDINITHGKFYTLLSSLQKFENVTLHIANNIFSHKDYRLLDEFQDTVKKSFLSEAQVLDFEDCSNAAKIINSWVMEKTKNKIRDVISGDILYETPGLVLVNAMYFKGLWEHSFMKAFTKPRYFYINFTEKKMVPMMHQTEYFGYADLKELRATALEMRYKDYSIRMFILLPNKVDGIAMLESKLEKADLGEILEDFCVEEVEVCMPKFTLEETTDFNNILKEMGMTDMFDKQVADFSGISGSKDLYVNKVIQKAYIEVNEEGSEAAVVTSEFGVPCCGSEMFIADHPFLFILWDKTTKSVLFMGRLSEP